MWRLAAALITAAWANACAAGPRPDWAFFIPAPLATAPAQAAAPAPSSDSSAVDILNPPDWYPNEHAPMPAIVAHGAAPSVEHRAPILPCALCHLPNGAGHVESASLAGLPAEYLIMQLAEIRSGERLINVGGPRAAQFITALKSAYTDDQVREAAEYYSRLPPRNWIEVRETSRVPHSGVDPDSLMRTASTGGGTEPLGDRIVELPQNESGLRRRDAHSGFIAYVPVGSIAKGKRLVSSADHASPACAACHGKSLNGLGGIPPLAGRPPTYLVRQLWNYQSGERRGAMAAPMQAVAARLRVDQMLVIAAYLASLPPGPSD
ncbi:MAG TPA: c-type cytochrome [Steroidobacteraceae bacterium]